MVFIIWWKANSPGNTDLKVDGEQFYETSEAMWRAVAASPQRVRSVSDAGVSYFHPAEINDKLKRLGLA